MHDKRDVTYAIHMRDPYVKIKYTLITRVSRSTTKTIGQLLRNNQNLVINKANVLFYI
jgi:hypothetical protein